MKRREWVILITIAWIVASAIGWLILRRSEPLAPNPPLVYFLLLATVFWLFLVSIPFWPRRNGRR